MDLHPLSLLHSHCLSLSSTPHHCLNQSHSTENDTLQCDLSQTRLLSYFNHINTHTHVIHYITSRFSCGGVFSAITSGGFFVGSSAASSMSLISFELASSDSEPLGSLAGFYNVRLTCLISSVTVTDHYRPLDSLLCHLQSPCCIFVIFASMSAMPACIKQNDIIIIT